MINQSEVVIYLTNRIKEHEDQVTEIRKPQYGLIHIEWVAHVSVHQSRSVYEGDEGELLLLGGGDLCGQVVHQVGHLSQGFEVRIEVKSGIAGQRLPLLARGDEGEALGLDGYSSSLHVLLYVPVDEGGLASRVITWDIN